MTGWCWWQGRGQSKGGLALKDGSWIRREVVAVAAGGLEVRAEGGGRVEASRRRHEDRQDRQTARTVERSAAQRSAVVVAARYPAGQWPGQPAAGWIGWSSSRSPALPSAKRAPFQSAHACCPGHHRPLPSTTHPPSPLQRAGIAPPHRFSCCGCWLRLSHVSSASMQNYARFPPQAVGRQRGPGTDTPFSSQRISPAPPSPAGCLSFC